MTKDDRLYAKFTLDFPDHPKILCLSVEAKWALVDMTIYSRRHLTDGWLSKPVAIAKWGLDVCLELASNDVEKPSLVEHETGFQIHDFAEHQTTKAEIKTLSEVRKAAGQKGGRASAQAKSKQVLKQNPSKIKPETETETETEEKKIKDLLNPDGSSDTTTDPLGHITEADYPHTFTPTYPEAFEQWWAHYPRKVGKRKALEAWKRARKRATDNQLTAGAKRYAADPNRADEFTKHPEGWLNRDGWLDEPIPAPNGSIPRNGSIIATSDRRVAETQALKHTTPGLELE